jgi:hypothetical protein
MPDLTIMHSELRNSLDTLRIETERQAAAHLGLAQSMRRELEAPATEYIAKQVHHKKTSQATIEKAFRTKQAQESFVAKVQTASFQILYCTTSNVVRCPPSGSGEIQD